MSLSDAQKARAEATFKRKEDQAHDGANAWAEYEAKSRAVRQKHGAPTSPSPGKRSQNRSKRRWAKCASQEQTDLYATPKGNFRLD